MTTVPYTFGTESSPIPLSQLDANFAATPNYANTAGNVVNADQANITSVGILTALSVSGNVNSGNLRTTGAISSTGNIITGNIATGGIISAYGTITGGSLSTVGAITAGTTITGANIATSGIISATGTITGGNILTNGQISSQGNITAQGIISATGNIVTDEYFVGNFLGNITGNISVGGSNTQVLFNSNGNVGAAGGLTYNAGSNTLGILGVVSAQGNIIGGNLDIGGNVVVTGTTQLIGLATAPTAPNGTANNQVATTAFVSTTVGTLGTMAFQNAISVAITGGTFGNAILTLATMSGSNISGSNISGGNISGSNISGGNISGSNISGVAMSGSNISGGNISGVAMSGSNISGGDISGGTITSATITGLVTAPTPATGTSNTQIATTAFVRAIIPTGVILMWSGSIGSIPSGWYLCDGGNSTPDLRDRFIVPAGLTYAVAATGGSPDSIVVSHTHTAATTATDAGHQHFISTPGGQGSVNLGDNLVGQYTDGSQTAARYTGITSASISAATTVSTAGVSGTNANLPPYYALAYIMKA